MTWARCCYSNGEFYPGAAAAGLFRVISGIGFRIDYRWRRRRPWSARVRVPLRIFQGGRREGRVMLGVFIGPQAETIFRSSETHQPTPIGSIRAMAFVRYFLPLQLSEFYQRYTARLWIYQEP